MFHKKLLWVSRLIALGAVMCLNSCKYESEELNFHTISPPNQDNKVNVNLADVPTGQTVYIYSPTDITYSINASTGAIVKYEFFINERLHSSDRGILHISPDDITKSMVNELKVKVELSSGTGSLAEILGEEKAVFEFSYPLKFVQPDVDLRIQQRVDETKKLVIYWDKPAVEGLEVESYEIYNFSNLGQILIDRISDPNRTEFLDEEYSYGPKTYKIITTFKGNKIPPREDFYSVKYNVFTTAHIEANTLKNLNLRIKWTHPDGIESKYVLVWNRQVQYIPVQQNSAEVYRPAFPYLEEQYYEIYVLPENADFWDYQKYPKVINYFKEQTLGDGTEPRVLFVCTEADYKNNLVLSMQTLRNDYGFRTYNSDNLRQQSLFRGHVQHPYYVSSFKVSPTKGRIAIHLRSNDYKIKPKIDVYSDHTLSRKLGSYPTDDFPIFFLTDDDKMMLSPNNMDNFKIYDINSGNLLSEKRENGQFRPAISADGKYTVSYVGNADGWYRLYSYQNNQYTLIKEKRNSRIYNDIKFHPTVKDQVVIQSIDNYFSICQLPDLKEIKRIPGEFLCFDAFTGNILYKDRDFTANSTVHVMDSKYVNVLFSIRASNYFQGGDVRLLKNHLILDNHYVNINQ